MVLLLWSGNNWHQIYRYAVDITLFRALSQNKADAAIGNAPV